MGINPFAFNKKMYKQYDQLHTLFPYMYFIDETVILQKDGILQSVLMYYGNDIEVLNESQVESFHIKINNILKNYGSEYGFYFDCIRKESNEYPRVHEFANEAIMLIEAEREYDFTNYTKTFKNEYYINITYKPNLFYEKIISNFSDASGGDIEKIVANFKKEVEDIGVMLSNYIHTELLGREKIIEYLYKAIYMKEITMSKLNNEMFFLDSIFCNPIKFSDKYVVTDNTYVGYLTIVGMPNESYDAMFFALNEIDMEYRMYIRWLPFTQEEAAKYLEKYERYYQGKKKGFGTMLLEGMTKEPSTRVNTGQEILANEATEANAENTVGELKFGFLSVTLSAYASTKEEIQEKLNILSKKASSNGMIIRHDKNNTIGSFLGMIPGNVYGNIRRYIMTTHNVIDFVPFFTSYQGKMYNEIVGSSIPHVVCTTKYQSMFYLNLCVGDVGHTLIVGPTGSGKSVCLTMLAIEYTKYENKKQKSRVIYFDKGASSLKITYAVEGRFYNIGKSKNIQLQPLRRLETNTDIVFASEFIELLLEMQKIQLTPEDKKSIFDTIEMLKTNDVKERNITAFLHYVNNDKIKTALQIYTEGNVYGDILDSIEEEDILKNPKWLVFEMDYLMSLGMQIMLPVIFYIFNRLDEIFKDRIPTLLILDECWLFFDNEIMKNKIKEWLKVLRKYKVSVIFATQEIADMKHSGIYETLISQVPNKIFLPDQQAMMPASYSLYEEIGLTDTEIRLLQSSTPKKDYYIKTQNGSRMFNFRLGEMTLSLIAIRPDEIEYLKTLENKENKLYNIICSYNMQEYYETLKEYYTTNYGGKL